GGHRLLFLWPNRDIHIKSLKRNGKEAVRILAKGSQTVAPPSTHHTGGKYHWCHKHGPDDLPPAPCPEWLLQHLVTGEAHSVKPAPTPPLITGDSPIGRATLYLAKCDPAISGHGGHNHTFKIACKLVKGFGLSQEQAFDLMWTYWNPACQPPWTD